MKHLSLLILLFCLLYATVASAQYPVGHRSFSFLDPDRGNRDVWGEVYYPATAAGDDTPLAAGQFPFIVFGHGFGMAWSEYSVWWEALVEEGYIVAFPRTEGAVFPFPSHSDFGQDLAFIINSYMAENADPASDFYQQLTGKNAVMGHSMGGGCSYLAAGDYNAAVETVVTFAAADTDPSAIAAAANINLPVLTVAGSADCVVQAGGAPIDIYNGLSAAPYKAYVEITNASHCQFGIASFGSICTLGETCSGFLSLADQHTQMFLSAQPWLDYHLKDDCAAWAVFKDNLYNNTAHTYLEAGALPAPSVSLSPSSAIICEGESVTLSATVSGGHCGISWSLDGSPLSETSGTILVSQAGTYTATAEGVDSDGTATVTVDVVTSPSVDLGGPYDFCEGESVLLDAGAGFASYAWSTGETTQSITVEEGGEYSVTVTSAGGCSASSLATLNERPIPTVTLDWASDSIIATAVGGNDFTFEWYFSDVLSQTLIPEITDFFALPYTTDYEGEWIVIAINEWGCASEYSNPIAVVQPAVEETFATFGLEVWPNPVGEVLYLELDNEHPLRARLEVVDMAGRILQSLEMELPIGQVLRLPVSHLPEGMYTLRVLSDEGLSLHQWVKAGR